MYESGNYAYRDLIDEVVVQKVAPGNLGDLLFRLPREANPYQRVLMQVEFSHSPLPDALALEPGQTSSSATETNTSGPMVFVPPVGPPRKTIRTARFSPDRRLRRPRKRPLRNKRRRIRPEPNKVTC
jgi:hypothetical protein